MTKTVGLLLCTYNRPHYLHQCLESIKRARLPKKLIVAIVDDGSTDPYTIHQITKFRLHKRTMLVFLQTENKSIKQSMMTGCNALWKIGCDIIINLDSDAIISNDFFERLLELKNKFPEHIITGFNCLTRNHNGSVRHSVLMEGDGFNLKASVGGLNMAFDNLQYTKWLFPALLKCLEVGGNWDYETCLASMRDGFEIVCAVPSVAQHIGIISAMGHAGIEPPDIATDFRPVHLPNVTLVAVDDNVHGIIMAADISCKDIIFGDVKLLSSSYSDDQRVVPIRYLGSRREYSVFMMKELANYITTPFFITIQADGYILNGRSFDDKWFNYDYIGAPWNWYSDFGTVGNGAMSFRSTRLHIALAEDDNIQPKNDDIIKNCEEDHNICRIYRKYLEVTYDIKFAPLKVANKFSIEAWGVKPPANKYAGQFGFHGKNVDFSESEIKPA